MACPNCGCKTVYEYDDEDDGYDDRTQRCAACGAIFDLDDHADEIDDEDEEAAPPTVADPQVKTPGSFRPPPSTGNSNRAIALVQGRGQSERIGEQGRFT